MIIEQRFPIFEKGRMLKKDALDLIRDYAPEYASLLFQNYGNGVLSGFGISGARGEILIGPGILKDGGSFFCMREEIRLPVSWYGQPVFITLKKSGFQKSPDYWTHTYELLLEPVRELEPGEYELGRFRLEQGAKLRAAGEYKDFYDLTTEFNTLNLINVPYACENGSCLSPVILKMYGKGVLGSKKAEPLDFSFAAVCLNSSGISLDLLKNYLWAKGERDTGEGNQEWYQSLKRLYSALVSGGGLRRQTYGSSGKTVID